MGSTYAAKPARWPERVVLALILLAGAAVLVAAATALGLPDLQVTITPASGATDNSAVALNVTLTNTGDAVAANVSVALSIDGNPTDPPLDFAPLGPGASASQSPAFALSCGYHSASATADPAGDVAESNEGNNNATAAAKVAPAAEFAWALGGTLGSHNLTLNASSSHGCAPLSFTWDVAQVGRLAGEKVTVGAPAGNLTVTLTALSQADATLSSQTTEVIEVPNRAPSASVGAVFPSALTGVQIGLTVLGSDSDGEVVAYFVDFGDGTSTGVLLNVSEHSYAQPGLYTVTARVVDNLNASGEATLTVEILNRPPEPRADPPYSFATAGAEITFNASLSRDPEGGPLTLSWEFGDGSTAQGPVVSHTYAASGVYNAKLTATDERGASSNVTVTVTILSQGGDSRGSNLLTAALLVGLAVFAVVYVVSVRRRHEESPGAPPAPKTEEGPR